MSTTHGIGFGSDVGFRPQSPGSNRGYSRNDRQDRGRILDVNNFDAIRISLASRTRWRACSRPRLTIAFATALERSRS